jgi:hypothetical protein
VCSEFINGLSTFINVYQDVHMGIGGRVGNSRLVSELDFSFLNTMAAVVDNVNGLVNGDATTHKANGKPIKSKNQLRRAKAKQKKASGPVCFSVIYPRFRFT